jgi:DNA-directed RNA polymerase subunit RPC12/RpoP
MKCFFIVLIVSNFVSYAMDNENSKKKLFLSPTESKYDTIPINLGNNKSRNRANICHTCNKQVVDIVRHNRRHTGERPYHCPYCDEKFYDSEPCANHIRNEHPNVKNPTYTVQFPGKKSYSNFVKDWKPKKATFESIEKSHKYSHHELSNINKDTVEDWGADFFEEKETTPESIEKSTESSGNAIPTDWNEDFLEELQTMITLDADPNNETEYLKNDFSNNTL